MKMFLADLLCLSLSLAILQGAQPPRDDKVGQLSIRLTTQNGFHAFEASFLLRHESGLVLRRSFRSPAKDSLGYFVLQDLPVGRYTIEIESPMLQTRAPENVLIKPGERWLTLTFPFGGIIADQHRRISLSGEVKAKGTKRRAWIRLVGAYSDTAVETCTDEAGRFRFDDVEQGEYVLIATTTMTTHSSLPVIRLITVRSSENHVVVEVD